MAPPCGVTSSSLFYILLHIAINSGYPLWGHLTFFFFIIDLHVTYSNMFRLPPYGVTYLFQYIILLILLILLYYYYYFLLLLLYIVM